jgi:hypothetical protein
MNREELKALAEVAASAGKASEKGKSAFSELIVETIEPNRITLDLFSAFMPVRSLQVGDQLVKRVRNRGFPVRTMVPGTNHLADQFVPGREIMTYMIDYMIAKTRYSLWELQRGELGTLDTFRREMESAMIDSLVSRVWSLLATVWTQTNTPNNYATVSTKITETVLENMIEQVLEKAGTVRSIIGTRKALLPIYKFAGLFEHTLTGGSAPTNTELVVVQNIFEEWRRSGKVSSFRGIPLIELPQIYERTIDNYDKKLLREDLILVIGDQAGEIITYGGIETQEHTDTSTEPPEYSLAMWRGWGMIVDEPERIGVIQIV